MIAYLFILFGAILRVVPHAANFTPIGAIALFGGTYLNKKYALAVPLAAMMVSDFFIGFDSVSSRAVVYGSILLGALIGLWLRNHKNVYTIAGASIVSSIVFFLITNMPVLYPTAMYPHTLEGALMSYTNALPFFRNSLMGDLFYTSVLFGSYELVMAWKAGKFRLNADSRKSTS
jgi:hypothetical protein